jgi:hypothetical protein
MKADSSKVTYRVELATQDRWIITRGDDETLLSRVWSRTRGRGGAGNEGTGSDLGAVAKKITWWPVPELYRDRYFDLNVRLSEARRFVVAPLQCFLVVLDG